MATCNKRTVVGSEILLAGGNCCASVGGKDGIFFSLSGIWYANCRIFKAG